MSITKKIEDVCHSLKHNKRSTVEGLIHKHFKDVPMETLLKYFLEFAEERPSYSNLLYKVVNKLKPKIYGVYILESEGVIVYVGKSIDVVTRLNAHSKDKVFDKVFVITLADSKSQALCESSLIMKYKPKYNRIVKLNEVLVDTSFEDNKRELKDWLESVEWFTRPSTGLQIQVGYSIHLSGYLMFKTIGDYLCFSTLTSLITVEAKLPDAVRKCNRVTQKDLEQAALKLNQPELFSVVTAKVYKFGNYYITEKGRWRPEGCVKWYSNVNLDKIVAEFIPIVKCVNQEKPQEQPIWFGKYKGKYYKSIMEEEPTYCDWLKTKLTKLQWERFSGEQI